MVSIFNNFENAFLFYVQLHSQLKHLWKHFCIESNTQVTFLAESFVPFK